MKVCLAQVMSQPDTTTAKLHDASGRRSRFVRTPTGKRIELGARDQEILRWLYRYGYLRQSQLVALLQPRSEKRLIERLGDLFHETGLINRPLAEPGSFDLRATPMLYEVTARGIDWLTARDALPHRAVTFSFRSKRAGRHQLPHTMMIIETLLAIELATMKADGQRFVPVYEILARASAATRTARKPLALPLTGLVAGCSSALLIPDALYGIEYDIAGEKRYRFWALECERTSPAWRSTMTASSTAKKKAAYDAVIRSGAYRIHWGIPNLKLQVVRASVPIATAR